MDMGRLSYSGKIHGQTASTSTQTPTLTATPTPTLMTTPTLLLIRGLPGSGKTTLAEQLLRSGAYTAHYEADQWMVDEQGQYKYDTRKTAYANEQCQQATAAALARGQSTIVTNTFTRLWMLKIYMDIARKYAYIPNVQIITCYGQASWPSHHIARESEAYRKMRAQWEHLNV